MPFTPFHLGPAICLGIPLRKYIHAPTFILANVILDIEPLLVLTIGLNYPLHGYLHTFIAAIVVGVFFGLGIFFLERIMHPLYKTLLLEPEPTFKKTNFIIAGVLGTMLHVLFDSPLYFDIKPFYPLTVNPLYGSVSSLEIYLLSFWLGVLGVVFCLLLLIVKSYKRLRKNQSESPTIKKYTYQRDYIPLFLFLLKLFLKRVLQNRSRSHTAEKVKKRMGRTPLRNAFLQNSGEIKKGYLCF